MKNEQKRRGFIHQWSDLVCTISRAERADQQLLKENPEPWMLVHLFEESL